MPGPANLIQLLTANAAAGTLFNTYTTAKSILNATDLTPILGNQIQPGSVFRIKMWGGLSNIVTTPGTVTFQIMMGSVVAWTSGALQLSTTANTLTPFDFEALLRVNTFGAGATACQFIGGAKIAGLSLQLGAGVANPTVSDDILLVPSGAPTQGTAFDSTTTQNLDFWVGFSISNAGNGIQYNSYTVEQLR